MNPPKSQLTGGERQVVFLIGHPVEHSFSPAMHNAAFRSLGLPWIYLPLDLEPSQLGPAAGLLRERNIRGANVTVPYKERILRHLDRVGEESRWLQSVNTIHKNSPGLNGTSTDGEGFLRSLGKFRKRLAGSTGLVIGAGGAARVVAAALADSGVRRLYLANRTASKSKALVRALGRRWRKLEAVALSLPEASRSLGECDWVVQGTSLGLHPSDRSPLSLGGAKPGTLAIDLIYHRRTAFAREAERRKLVVLNGLGMLLYQGALSFQIWTGRKAPLAVMARTLSRLCPQSRPWVAGARL